MDDSAHPTAPHPAILIVEDDPAIRELVRDALHAEGVRVVAPSTHADALVALTALRFGLVLADTAGWSAVANGDPWADLDRLRAAAGATPTVIFSAHNPAAFDGYAARGFAGLISKPFDLEELTTVVRRSLAARPRQPRSRRGAPGGIRT